jgi:hypothetical protein
MPATEQINIAETMENDIRNEYISSPQTIFLREPLAHVLKQAAGRKSAGRDWLVISQGAICNRNRAALLVSPICATRHASRAHAIIGAQDDCIYYELMRNLRVGQSINQRAGHSRS